MPCNHLILCHPLLLLPSIFPNIRVFPNESALQIRWPKYWSFSFSIRLSNEYSGLISFRIDWLDLLEVQGALKSLLQHHSSKASILWHPAYSMVQLSHLYMTTGKNITLTIRTFVNKVMSLLFNTLSRCAISFSSKEQTCFNFMSWGLASQAVSASRLPRCGRCQGLQLRQASMLQNASPFYSDQLGLSWAWPLSQQERTR